MDDIIIKDIKKLKNTTAEEVDYLYKIRPDVQEYIVVKFQESLHTCLQEYLNTPFLLSKKKSVTIDELKERYSELNLSALGFDLRLKIKDLPSIIVSSFSILESLINSLSKRSYKRVIVLENLKNGYYSRHPVLQEYVEFTKNKLSKYLKNSLIHGSCADLELTAFSDLDTFLIVSKETMGSEKMLVDFKRQWIKSLKYLYKFDSLQHHNHMIATEFDLDFFPYHWLPPQVFESAILVYGNSNLNLNIYKSDFFNATVFFSLVQRFRDSNILSKSYNEYTLKNDLSILALIPTLYLQTIGINVTKKESFSHESILLLDTTSFYKKISKIRLAWSVSKKSNFIISTLYNYYLRKVYLKYFISPVEVNEITKNHKIQKGIISELNMLIDTMSHNMIIKGYERRDSENTE